MKYMGMKEMPSYVELDMNCEPVKEITQEYLKKSISPLKEGTDDFWYMAFLLKFKKIENNSENNLSWVKGEYCPIIGLKILNETYEIKTENKKLVIPKYEVENLMQYKDLIILYDNINDDIKRNIQHIVKKSNFGF